MTKAGFSLRRRLTLGTVGACFVAMLFAAMFVHFIVRRTLLHDFDRVQVAKARTVAALIDFEGNRIELEGQLAPEYLRAASPEYAQLWRGTNEVMLRSPSLRQQNLSRLPIDRQRMTPSFVTLPDGRRGRQVQLSMHPSVWRTHESDGDDDWGEEACDDDDNDDDDDDWGEDGDEDEPFENEDGFSRPTEDEFMAEALTLVVASGTEQLDRTLARLGFALLLVSGSTAAACGAFLARYIPHGLRSLSQLTESIESVEAHDLGYRVCLPSAPEELVPVVQKFNNLLGRLDGAFNREKAFTSNVAHELRTPIAGIRSNLELAMIKQRSPEEYQRLIGVSLSICNQMQRAVESLLSLARLDAGNVVMQRESVSVTDTLVEAWNLVTPQAQEREVPISWQLDEGLMAEADRDNLRLAFCNILKNAAAYCASPGSIQVRSNREGTNAVVSVSNPIAIGHAQPAQVVFDRFWRGTPKSEPEDGHTGLGLPISKMIIEAMGGQISVSGEHGQFQIDVSVPADRESLDHPRSSS